MHRAALIVALGLGCGGDGTTTQSSATGTGTVTDTAGEGPSTGAPTTGTPTTGTSTPGGSTSGGGPTTGEPGTTSGPGATTDASTGAGSEGSSGEGTSSTGMGVMTGTTGAGTDTGESTSGTDTGEEGPLPAMPSAGCGLGGSPTGHLDNLKTSVDGVERLYDLFVPKPYDKAKPHAVIFTYHGVGGTANTEQFKLDTFSAAEGGFSINVAPQGWPSPEWDENHFVPFNLDASLQVFDQVLAELAAKYCVDLNRVFAIGHSNGGQMAFHLGCLRGGTVRAVFPSGGRCFSYGPGVCDPYHDLAHQCVGQTMVMSVMGELDVERHADEEATLAGFRARQGCGAQTEAVTPMPCLRFTGCDAGGEVSTCRIPELGHQLWKDGLKPVYKVMMGI